MIYISEKEVETASGPVLIVESSGFPKEKILRMIHGHCFKGFENVGFWGDNSNLFHDELDMACIEGDYNICTYLLEGYSKKDLWDLLSQFRSDQIRILIADTNERG